MNKEGIKDEKLDYFSEEIIKFHEFMVHVSEEITNEKMKLNSMEMVKRIGDFYDKFKDKYNKNQLVYQFLMKTYKNDKYIIKMYKAFQKLKESQ